MDKDHIVYHASNTQFDEFDPKKFKSSTHVYAALSPKEAEHYGRYVMEFEFTGNAIDLTPQGRSSEGDSTLNRYYEYIGHQYWETETQFLSDLDHGKIHEKDHHNIQNEMNEYILKEYDALVVADENPDGTITTSFVIKDPGMLSRTDTPTLPFCKWIKPAGEIFGDDSSMIRYEDPSTGGTLDIRDRGLGQPASVLGFYVPDEHRGTGAGKRLMTKVLEEHPSLMGQCSTQTSAAIAYKFGRRPAEHPNASLEDVFEIIREYSSVNLVTTDLQNTARPAPIK